MSQDIYNKIIEWLDGDGLYVDLQSADGYSKFIEYLQTLVINQ